MGSEVEKKFRIKSPLRCDGVGSLDCAEDTQSGMRLAIRWLPVDANGEAAVKAVEEMPRHPVLPRIRQTGRVGSSAYVAMDFPEGRLLATLIGVEKIPVEHVSRMGGAVAEALAILHAQGVVHGELSADSVLMLPEGRAILWDAPLVLANRLTDRRGEERALAQLIKVAPYLAPERARGLPASAHSDVYALGAVMCIAAGGELPPGGTTLAVVHQVANGQWTPELPRSMTPALRALVKRMIQPDPLVRPTAQEAADALTALLERTPTIPELRAVQLPPPLPAVIAPPHTVSGDLAAVPANGAMPPAPRTPGTSAQVATPSVPSSVTGGAASSDHAAITSTVARATTSAGAASPDHAALTSTVARAPTSAGAASSVHAAITSTVARAPTPVQPATPVAASVAIADGASAEAAAPATSKAFSTAQPAVPAALPTTAGAGAPRIATTVASSSRVAVESALGDDDDLYVSQASAGVAAQKKRWVMGAAAILGGLALLTAGVTVVRRSGASAVESTAVTPAKSVPEGSSGMRAREDVSEFVAPLVRPVNPNGPTFKPAAAGRPGVLRAAPARASRDESVAAQPAPATLSEHDFSFLPTDVPAPKTELKRPSF